MTAPAPLLPAVGDSAYWAAGTLELDGFAFSTSPWISGLRAAFYYGPVSAELLVDEGADYELAELELLVRLRAKVLERGGNACVGLEVAVDLFDRKGVRLYAVGTGAKLERLK